MPLVVTMKRISIFNTTKKVAQAISTCWYSLITYHRLLQAWSLKPIQEVSFCDGHRANRSRGNCDKGWIG